MSDSIEKIASACRELSRIAKDAGDESQAFVLHNIAGRLDSLRKVPDGYVLVPYEPTFAMVVAGQGNDGTDIDGPPMSERTIARIYQSMIDAAPTADHDTPKSGNNAASFNAPLYAYAATLGAVPGANPAPPTSGGCGACGDGCAKRGACQLVEESPSPRMYALAASIRREADIADRPGQMARLNAIADELVTVMGVAPSQAGAELPESCGQNDDELPGMWSHSDFMGGKSDYDDSQGCAELPEPVAVVGPTWLLAWAGAGPIAPLVRSHGMKIGDGLYTAGQMRAYLTAGGRHE